MSVKDAIRSNQSRMDSLSPCATRRGRFLPQLEVGSRHAFASALEKFTTTNCSLLWEKVETDACAESEK